MAATGDPELTRAPDGTTSPVRSDQVGSVLTADRNLAEALAECTLALLAEQRESRRMLCKLVGELFEELPATRNLLGT